MTKRDTLEQPNKFPRYHDLQKIIWVPKFYVYKQTES